MNHIYKLILMLIVMTLTAKIAKPCKFLTHYYGLLLMLGYYSFQILQHELNIAAYGSEFVTSALFYFLSVTLLS